MINYKWTELDHLQIGRIGEYYAKMVFVAFGFDVYESEVDNHGVDFIARNKNGVFLDVQVKTLCKSNYMYINKSKITLDDRHIVALIRLVDGKEPEMYVFPSSVWMQTDDVFKNRNKKYKEWGFNYSNRNRPKIENYLISHGALLNLINMK